MKLATPVDLIVLKDDKILLLKRSENEDFHVGKWSFPGGGMEEGETKEETLAREVMEETGCEIKWFKQFREFEYQMDDTLVKATYYFGEVEGEIILSEEHSEFDWFSFEEIKSLDIAFNQKEVLIEFEKFYKSSN